MGKFDIEFGPNRRQCTVLHKACRNLWSNNPAGLEPFALEDLARASSACQNADCREEEKEIQTSLLPIRDESSFDEPHL